MQQWECRLRSVSIAASPFCLIDAQRERLTNSVFFPNEWQGSYYDGGITIAMFRMVFEQMPLLGMLQ
jgi:hypothetical protein